MARYTGSTDDLGFRIRPHREGAFSGFTTRYAVHHLVWFEAHPTRDATFRRERQIKEWRRRWKLDLIEGFNPDWLDLSESLEAAPWRRPVADEIDATPDRRPLPR